MQLTRYILLLSVAVAVSSITRAQQKKPADPAVADTVPFNHVLDLNPRYRENDPYKTWQYSGICKVLKASRFLSANGHGFADGNDRKAMIKVQGNIFYDFFYRSFSDTPYYQKDFRQHTIQSAMHITVNDKYSFRFNMAVRISNSPWFKNFFDAGVQFNRSDFLTRMKQYAEGRMIENLLQQTDLPRVEALLEEELRKYDSIRFSISRPNLSQLLIEERQARYYHELRSKLPTMDNKIDTVVSRVENYVAEKRHELDSLQERISRMKHKADSLRHVLQNATASVKQKIYKTTNVRELKQVMTENAITDEKRDKWEKIIADTRSIGIGRSMVNYSELTVNNVSLTGINIEYNPRIYTALAAGKIDYGFRDFIGQNKQVNKQNLLMGRVGLGDRDRMAIILSVFTGRKYNYGSGLSDTVNSYIHVTGYSIEGILKKNENVGLNIEVAKSTKPVTGRLRTNQETKSLFRFDDRSNQAISIKGQTFLPKTNTRLSGFFRKSGQNFQSFSLFTYNTDQTAWLLKADQYFFKNSVGIIAMLRRNDFTNPFTEKTFKTSTVFTSAQLNVRIPRWPAVSIGYHPGSQLYIVDRERIRENVYHIINGSLIHTYSLSDLRMVSSAVYNYYSNKGTDSGFVNYNGRNYILSHSLLFRKFQLNGGFTYTDQRELNFYTLETNVDYFPVSCFKIGVGGKYNRTQEGLVYWGGRAQVMLEIKKLGGLQIQYEKSYLPTIYRTLFPVETGRASWFKYF